jgi:hypothetical protein
MMLDIGKVKKIGLFASGVLFGTAEARTLRSSTSTVWQLAFVLRTAL